VNGIQPVVERNQLHGKPETDAGGKVFQRVSERWVSRFRKMDVTQPSDIQKEPGKMDHCVRPGLSTYAASKLEGVATSKGVGNAEGSRYCWGKKAFADGENPHDRKMPMSQRSKGWPAVQKIASCHNPKPTDQVIVQILETHDSV